MKVLKKDDKGYPKLLKKIKNFPSELYVDGDECCLNKKCVTVVGSRNMTDYGRNMTKEIVKELTLGGVCIVSGLAVGIDSIAHQTCLDNGGKTIAVLGSGLNKIYPIENIGLYKDILNNRGCVISEQEPDTEAQKIFFPARNRIVSGLSLATVVVEATYRSGTSITAKFAFEQERKVFCVPNSVGNKNSSGTINLIKKGARMVTTGREILYELGIIEELDNYEEFVEQQKFNKINLLEQEVLSTLEEKTKNVYSYIKENRIVNSEVMCNELKMNIQDINMHLTILELKGLIFNKSGSNYVVREEFYI